MARQIQVTKDYVDRVRKLMPAADEKIRLAQVALQEATNEKDYDICELLLAEARLERPPEGGCDVTTSNTKPHTRFQSRGSTAACSVGGNAGCPDTDPPTTEFRFASRC